MTIRMHADPIEVFQNAVAEESTEVLLIDPPQARPNEKLIRILVFQSLTDCICKDSIICSIDGKLFKIRFIP